MTLLVRIVATLASIVCLSGDSLARAPEKVRNVVVCQTLDDAANISHAVGEGDLSRWVLPEMARHNRAILPLPVCQYRAEVEIAEVHGTPSAPGVIAVALRDGGGNTVFVVPVGRPENIFHNRICELPGS